MHTFNPFPTLGQQSLDPLTLTFKNMAPKPVGVLPSSWVECVVDVGTAN